MRVTAEGRRRGYFDLACGELVHTPQSKLQDGARVQLPLRKGMLWRILLGERAAGKKKKADTQKNLLCLSLVEKQSMYGADINNPLGLYEWRRRKVMADAAADWFSGPRFERPLDQAKFCWVVTSAKCTSPDGWIERMNPSDDFDGKFPSDGRIYTFDLRSDQNEGDFIQDYSYCGIYKPGDTFFNFVECTFASYTVPSKIETALGQAKRAMVATSHKSSVGKRQQMAATPAAEPAAKSRRGSSSRTAPHRASSARCASGAMSARRASAA
eukprot:3825903-Prymnesium_polylepis.1